MRSLNNLDFYNNKGKRIKLSIGVKETHGSPVISYKINKGSEYDSIDMTLSLQGLLNTDKLLKGVKSSDGKTIEIKCVEPSATPKVLLSNGSEVVANTAQLVKGDGSGSNIKEPKKIWDKEYEGEQTNLSLQLYDSTLKEGDILEVHLVCRNTAQAAIYRKICYIEYTRETTLTYDIGFCKTISLSGSTDGMDIVEAELTMSFDTISTNTFSPKNFSFENPPKYTLRSKSNYTFYFEKIYKVRY